ncbi:hypothetical protein Bhyg_12569 [Pseudolycoriella hygida]|uniref:Uncharacterized protein n=1 Tax=Pseudolycoriella hygida TaxID=35572 RepID=A0A9Q0MZT9_9DIPT|nr:hypothetical protein Bhyg_12569 [Pseudolycoriella hygida]
MKIRPSHLPALPLDLDIVKWGQSRVWYSLPKYENPHRQTSFPLESSSMSTQSDYGLGLNPWVE